VAVQTWVRHDVEVSSQLDPALPGWQWEPDEIRRLASRAAGLVAEALIAGSADDVMRRPSRNRVNAWATESWPTSGTSEDSLWDEVRAAVIPYPFGNGHPRFSAWVNSPPHPLAAMAAGIASAMNPSVAGGNHAAVHLEHQVVRWFCELLGWPVAAGGQLVSGASAAALTALTVARHRAAANIGVDDRRTGVSGLGRRPLIYATAQAHGCHTKAVEALGIGSANIVEIAADDSHRMIPDLLDRQLAEDISSGHLPIAVIATVGTVNTGAVDPIEQIAAVCKRHGVWMHVDAAYGGPAVLLTDVWPVEKAALSAADSLAVDPHKWLYVPVDAGLVMFSDMTVVRDTFSHVPDYLRSGGDPDEPVWFSEFGLEQTRPFRALKVWITLKHLGRRRLGQLINRDMAVAAALVRAVDESPDFELLAHGLSVVCFRHRPAGLPADALDDHNQSALRHLQQRGHAFIAGTRVDDHFALRACVVNPATTTTHTNTLLDDIRSAAAS
jgi:glutamate/tyrosine decarboxylase-like PLP-dependent enzyme